MALYIAVAALLAFRYDSFNGDAVSRLANAYYMLHSRDPHLAAIGFVWNPLPSFLTLPFVALRSLWTPLVSRAFGGNLVSAACMAGTVVVLCGTLRDAGTPRLPRLVVTALFAVNPMIVYYAGNGMSEGLFLLTLLVSCRHLLRWLMTDSLRSLIVGGTALGIAYLARNEAVFAAASSGLLVAAVALARARGSRRKKLMSAITDSLIFSAPFAVSFIGWAVTSWVIVGNPFEQFSSIYGTTSQLQVMNRIAGGSPSPDPVSVLLRELFALSPLLLLLLVAAVVVMTVRRDIKLSAPLAVLGGVLTFAVLADLAGQTAGWFRYYLTEVPLAALIVGLLLARTPRSPRVISAAKLRGVVTAGIAFVALAPGLVTTYQAMRDPAVGREETLHLNSIFVKASSVTREQFADQERWRDASRVARDIDSRHLGHGKVLVDNFTACIPYILLDSRHPQDFVIPNDRDYQRILADPATFHTDYFLIPDVSGFGALDAVNRAYPTMYKDGGGIATVVTQYSFPGCPPLRLYRLGSNPAAPLPSPAPKGS